jgi:small subunit ribosomal protein S2
MANQLISVKSMLDAAAHFGHRTARWNPKMKPYIFGVRQGVHIIDLKQTLVQLDKAYSFVSKLVEKRGTLLFVGTKKQAQEGVAEAAQSCGMPYVNHRWLGGMLTNFATIRSRVKRLEEIEAMIESGQMETFVKKEQIVLQKELQKLHANLDGIRDMTSLPKALFIVDSLYEEIAVKEAHRLGIPVIAMLDTNADPDVVDIPIPANDDSIRSIKLICNLIANAVQSAQAANVSAEEMAAAPEPQVIESKPVHEVAQAVAETPKETAAPAQQSPAKQDENLDEILPKTVEDIAPEDLAKVGAETEAEAEAETKEGE